MRKKSLYCKILCAGCVLTLGLHVWVSPLQAEQHLDMDYIFGRELTKEEIQAMQSLEPTEFAVGENEVSTPIYHEPKVSLLSVEDALPPTYSSVNKGLVTEVKNQYPWGTCWAFGALNSMESSLIANGVQLHGNITTIENTDLSERHLAYFTYHSVLDPLGNTEGDSITLTGKNYLDKGGNNTRTMFALANWKGAVDEADAPYSVLNNMTSDIDTYNLDSELAYQDDVVLKDAYAVNFANRDVIKQLIQTYGAGSISYYWASSDLNYSTGAYYNGYVSSVNHTSSIVGWDDNYSKSNFNEEPENDGAWLVKNSWGSEWGDKGYFWLSYEDLTVSSTSGNSAYFFCGQSSDAYDYNYQYDGSISTIYTRLPSGGSMANRFVVPQTSTGEELKAISFAINSTNVDYSVQVYKNGNASNPISGTAQFVEPQSGNVSYAGYHTIPLEQAVSLQAGDSFTIVVSFTSTIGDTYVNVYTDKTSTNTYDDGSKLVNVNTVNKGESFYKGSRSSSWVDIYNSNSVKSPRIKGFTISCE